MQDIKQKFVGTWSLVHSVEMDAQGNKRYPFGEDAMGYIMYEPTGIMSVQIFRKSRKLFASKNFVEASVDELANIPKDYLAYCGRYDVDMPNQLVRHHIEGHLFSNTVGKILERKYFFYDDKLSLKPNDGTNREILWKRIK